MKVDTGGLCRTTIRPDCNFMGDHDRSIPKCTMKFGVNSSTLRAPQGEPTLLLQTGCECDSQW